jgi:two-component system, sensor histidine kinase and response regulator
MKNNNKNLSSILVIDDTTENLQVVGSILREAGYKVLVATNGNAGLQIADKELPELILLDIMMPGMDGFSCAESLKSNISTSKIPIIFLSARTDQESILKAFEIGGCDYISKPFIAKELLARVKSMLQIKHNAASLEKIIDMKNHFFDTITLCLKNPLSQIISYSQMLHSDRLEPEYARMISETAMNQFKAFENILEITRLQTGNTSLFIEEIDLLQSIEKTISLFSIASTSKKLEINVDISTGLVMADERLLDVLLRNILDNAIKFSSEKGTIEINAAEKNGTACISVRDYGVGMTQTEADSVMISHLESLRISVDSEAKGDCLGLIASKEIAKYMNGWIEIKGYGNKGAEVLIFLPID